MMPLETQIVDLGKEVITMCMAAGFSWVLHHVQSLVKDLNNYFAKVRSMETRLAELEKRAGTAPAAQKEVTQCKAS